MARYLSRIVVLGLMLVGGVLGLKFYQGTDEAKLREKDQIIAQERQKNEVLHQMVTRLETDKRMARIIVTDQQARDGQVQTTILFSEYNRDGTALVNDSTKQYVLEGTSIYVDTYVVEFEDAMIEANDPLRGHSLAVFKRIFGQRGPAQGFDLISSGDAPLGHQSDDPKQAVLEQSIWKDFWKLSEDPKLRKEMGVKRAFGVSAFHEDFKPGFVYTLTLDARGGLRMDTEPMDPLMKKALEQKTEKAN